MSTRCYCFGFAAPSLCRFLQFIPLRRSRFKATGRCSPLAPTSPLATPSPRPALPPRQWHNAEVPGTVVGALVTDKTLPDPNFGMNLKSFPGVSLGGEEPFSNRDMPADSPFRCSYWFRTEFTSPASFSSKVRLAAFPGYQLPRQYLAQRKEDCRPSRCRRRVSRLRVPRKRSAYIRMGRTRWPWKSSLQKRMI